MFYRLEYKYMKLVTSSSGKEEGELPAAETCALSDDEEDQYDAVAFKEGKSGNLFSKIKNIGKKVGQHPCIVKTKLDKWNSDKQLEQ